MDHFTKIEKKLGCDIGRSNGLHHEDGKWRVGKEGVNKNLRLNDLVELAYTMDNPRPNIIIKGGKDAKWYLKYCIADKIDEQIKKPYNRRDNVARCIMYIITWE